MSDMRDYAGMVNKSMFAARHYAPSPVMREYLTDLWRAESPKDVPWSPGSHVTANTFSIVRQEKR